MVWVFIVSILLMVPWGFILMDRGVKAQEFGILIQIMGLLLVLITLFRLI